MGLITDVIQLLNNHAWLAVGLLIIISLLIGSFLNVVIHRLPLMLFREWYDECQQFLAEYKPTELPKRFNLYLPHSYCTTCNTPLKIQYNIPLLSYLWLKGQCAYCHAKISWQYPLIESLSLLFAIIIGWRYGISWETLALLVLTFALIANATIDLKHEILPDNITLPLLWLGLLLNTQGLFTTTQDAILGAVMGYVILWTPAWLYKAITKRVGMAHGDFKLFAMVGAWFGWQALPATILIASVSAVCVSMALMYYLNYTRHTPIPFGPYIALAGWMVGVFQLMAF